MKRRYHFERFMSGLTLTLTFSLLAYLHFPINKIGYESRFIS